MSIGWSPGPDRAAEMREIFDRLNCRERFLNAKPSRLEPMPKDCEEILYSISFFAFEGEKRKKYFRLFDSIALNPSLIFY